MGGGIIGLSLSIALRKRGMRVLIVERGEPGREASYAAAGMLADSPMEIPVPLRQMASASAKMYPEFVHELQDESGMDVDLRDEGTLILAANAPPNGREIAPSTLSEFEPALASADCSVFHLKERSVDPRALAAAALKAAKHRQVDIASGAAVREIVISADKIEGVRTEKTAYAAPTVVNCAGAWAGQLGSPAFPVRPVKGQMLVVVGGPRLRHVIRSPDVYLVPRSDARILIGSTLEDAGYDKRTYPETIQRLHQSALRLIPDLGRGRIHEAWAGLRPGTPDNLPILGATQIPGYYVATGHFRDGILLTPVTARLMAQVISGEAVEHDLSPFSPQRFPH